MSIHSSLRGVDTHKGERSVFTRIERLAVLKKEGKFDDKSSSVYGLPKVRTRFKVAGAKKKAAKAETPAVPGAGAVAAPVAAVPEAKPGDKKSAAAKKPGKK